MHASFGWFCFVKNILVAKTKIPPSGIFSLCHLAYWRPANEKSHLVGFLISLSQTPLSFVFAFVADGNSHFVVLFVSFQIILAAKENPTSCDVQFWSPCLLAARKWPVSITCRLPVGDPTIPSYVPIFLSKGREFVPPHFVHKLRIAFNLIGTHLTWLGLFFSLALEINYVLRNPCFNQKSNRVHGPLHIAFAFSTRRRGSATLANSTPTFYTSFFFLFFSPKNGLRRHFVYPS